MMAAVCPACFAEEERAALEDRKPAPRVLGCTCEPAELRKRDRTNGAAAATAADAPRAPSTPREVLTRLAAHGAAVHVPTGIAPLDEMTRGGPRLGDLVTILGAPNAAKTMLATIIADTRAADASVGIYAVDEDAEGIVSRLAQRRGWHRDAFEGRRDFAELAALMPELSIYDATWSLDAAIADLATRAGDRPTILVADSLQAIAELCATEDETQTRAVSRALAALRRAAMERRWLVIATSEMVRAAYSGPERTSALAAGKWSGSIEYAAKVQIAVANVAGEPDLVHVEIAKNKLGSEGEFHLRIDRARQRVEVAEAPHADGDDAASARGHDQIVADAAIIAAASAAAPGCSGRDLYPAVRARSGSMSRDRYDTARAHLRRAGALVVSRGARGAEIHALDGSLLPEDVLDAVPLTDRPAVASARPPSPPSTKRRRRRS